MLLLAEIFLGEIRFLYQRVSFTAVWETKCLKIQRIWVLGCEHPLVFSCVYLYLWIRYPLICINVITVKKFPVWRLHLVVCKFEKSFFSWCKVSQIDLILCYFLHPFAYQRLVTIREKHSPKVTNIGDYVDNPVSQKPNLAYVLKLMLIS